MTSRATFAFLAALAFVACARERVEVAESETSSTLPEQDEETFGDGGVDARTSCGSPPSIGRCAEPCKNGYRPLPDGAPTCDCCP